MKRFFLNETDVSILNFKYLRRSIGFPTQTDYGGDWLKNSLTPIVPERRWRYIPITVTLIYKLSTNNFETDFSKLLSIISDSFTLKFSDSSYIYKAILLPDGVVDKVVEGSSMRQVILSIGAFSKLTDEVVEIANRVTNKAIEVNGTAKSPVTIEITPSVNLAAITVEGFDKPFTISNLTAGNTVIVNGEDGTVLQDGQNKYSDYDSWGFPVLKPGMNSINFSTSSTDVSIKYKPSWL